MKQLKKNERGFSVFESVLVIVVVILFGVVGWIVYKNHHKTNPPTSSTTNSTSTKSTTTPLHATTTDTPYSGWKSFTSQYQKLTLKYPSNWEVTSQSSTSMSVSSIDGSMLSLTLGQYSGVQSNRGSLLKSVPVTFLNQADYLNYYSIQQNNNSETSVLLSTSSTQLIYPQDPMDGAQNYIVSYNLPSNQTDALDIQLIIESATGL